MQRRGCARYQWCTQQGDHDTHWSESALGTEQAQDVEHAALYVETDPETGEVTYGPVLGGGREDRPVHEAYVMAAQLRVTAARLESMVAWAAVS